MKERHACSIRCGCLTLILLAACAAPHRTEPHVGDRSGPRQTAPPPGAAADEARVLSSTTVRGSGYPAGQSSMGPHMRLTARAASADYGYSPEHPVKVGGLSADGLRDGPKSSQTYLNSLAGSNGESLSYVRRGSCCPFTNPELPLGGGLLDVYELTFAGAEQSITVYINVHETGELAIPKGLTAAP